MADQPLTPAERYVLRFLRDHGVTTHSSLTAELGRQHLGGSLELGADDDLVPR
jgi:hypothetical protein